MTETDVLTEALTRLARGTPGVKALYAAGPAIPRLITEATNAVRGQAAMAHVDADADGISVSINIGVDGSESAADICRRVYESVTDYVVGHGAVHLKEISVTVASIG